MVFHFLEKIKNIGEMSRYSYSIDSHPSGLKRSASVLEKNQQNNYSDMEVDDSDGDSSDSGDDAKRGVKIGHVLNPATGRWCKMTGRVFNKIVNEQLGNAPRDRRTTQVEHVGQTKQSEPDRPAQDVDIWRSHGF